MTSNPLVASRRRLLLAIYLDFLLFMVVWGLANFIIGGEAHFVVGIIAFVAIRFAASKLGVSPGQYFLSIGRDQLVDADVYDRENWLTMLLGAVCVLEGSKLLVNWTQGIVSEPFFGSMPGETAQVTIDMVSGVLLVVVGFLYFKLRALGFWLALAAVIASLASTAVSWSLWLEAIPKVVSARRAAQGRVPTEGELQFMQTFLLSGTMVLLLCVLVGVLLTYRRFLPHRRRVPGPQEQ
jgi:hypothetical protein